MVNIAIAGGSGQLAREVLDVLMVTQAHDIIILSRSEPSSELAKLNVHWRCVDYENHTDLIEALRGVHTLLSFVQLLSDPEGKSQKSLINAAIAADVKRFAPSEYGSASTTDMPWWAGKEATREYLRTVNANGTVLEYTLFQPGLFLDYLAYPYKTSKHVEPLQSIFDFQNCRAIVVDGYEDAAMTLTSVADVAAVIVQAINYEGKWPEIGGIMGNKTTFTQVVRLGERIRGCSFTIERARLEDLKRGNLTTSWALMKRHQAVEASQFAGFVNAVTIGILLANAKDAFTVSDEYNQLLHDYKFDDIEGFLKRAWDGKP